MAIASVKKPRGNVHADNRKAHGTEIPGITRPMTYEEYLAEETVRRRYDIIDGIRYFVASPTKRHQRIQGNVYVAFLAFELAQKRGEALAAPCDVTVRRVPIRTRQPDALFISHDRLALNLPADAPGGLSPAPELVVEILSQSDTKSVLSSKIADYCAVEVRECWVVSPGVETVEVLRLLQGGEVETAAVYAIGEAAASEVFPGLSVAVLDVFAV